MHLIPGRSIGVREKILAMPSGGGEAKHMYAEISAQIGLVAKKL